MSTHNANLDTSMTAAAAAENQEVQERREFLRRAGLLTGAAVVGGTLGSSALAQPVTVQSAQMLRAAPILLNKVALETRLTGIKGFQDQSQKLAESAMILRGLELVQTFNPAASADFGLSFGLKW